MVVDMGLHSWTFFLNKFVTCVYPLCSVRWGNARAQKTRRLSLNRLQNFAQVEKSFTRETEKTQQQHKGRAFSLPLSPPFPCSFHFLFPNQLTMRNLRSQGKAEEPRPLPISSSAKRKVNERGAVCCRS